MLTACGDDETSNVATQENTPKEEVKLGPACTHNVPTDETFEFKVLNIEGNPIPDALVCITPDKNSANCSGSMVSVRTNIDGVARIRMSHNIVDDYRITVLNRGVAQLRFDEFWWNLGSRTLLTDLVYKSQRLGNSR